MTSERLAVLVNGLPGAGKTTLASALSAALGRPRFSKDVIKRRTPTFWGRPGPDGRSDAGTGRSAQPPGTRWNLLAAAPAGAVLESCWSSDTVEFVTRGLALAGHP